MPAIIDHEKVKMEILEAFQSCINEKPLTSISLRDIAEKSGMSHSKLLYYFKNKHELLISYVQYTREFITEKLIAWFEENPREDYGSNLEYMNALLAYVAKGKSGEVRPNATTQTYVLARYDKEIEELVMEEFRHWRETTEQCLTKIYGPEVGAREAEVMMILVSGIFLCNYNRVLTGEINENILGCLDNLAK